MPFHNLNFKKQFKEVSFEATESTIEVGQRNLQQAVEIICTQSRYPLLGLRLMLHVLCHIDTEGQVSISARRLSANLNVHYDTVSKSLKFLREIGIIRIER